MKRVSGLRARQSLNVSEGVSVHGTLFLAPAFGEGYEPWLRAHLRASIAQGRVDFDQSVVRMVTARV